ncbi:hypothetical protein C497_01495 [Halalkalicoccus jeotgali B3]|uniref:Uncharacterized protein n=1 Tax=Halalkalicoccus jeotgali (strain DSM 18796 / CECT 7217 / JCM 14584 / KCTC 4019 / B3) TaxID=795797 RepID=D8JB59_HALJB|nr:hypothetical protein HacjB3_15761 [Halalkalicoccus jeotgali B3]ELY41393.1 hypothetical protein C497_01495 [Halalkalicoccus jeotgali B3]
MGFRERLKNTAGLFTNTKVVSKERQYERSCIAASGVLNALGCRVYLVNIYINIERQKRIYAGINAKFTLDPSQERLCIVDSVLTLKETTQRSWKVFDINLAALLVTKNVVEIKRLIWPHQIEEKSIIFHVPKSFGE